MKGPMPINLTTPEEVRAQGWMAEARDAEGHLMSTQAPFFDDEDIVWFVREAIHRGHTVTIWPHQVERRSEYYIEGVVTGGVA
jgi:hypothetical protein